jgi:hypothetical protein
MHITLSSSPVEDAMPVNSFSQVTSITFDSESNCIIPTLSQCVNLHTVTIASEYGSRNIDFLPFTIKTLIFKIPIAGYKYDSYILKRIKRFTNLEHLTLGENFTQPIDEIFDVPFPHLKTLIFGVGFNHSISSLSNCPNLQTIKFGKYFNQPIDALKHCTGLKTVIFDDNAFSLVPIASSGDCSGHIGLPSRESFSQFIEILKTLPSLEDIYLPSDYIGNISSFSPNVNIHLLDNFMRQC